MSSMCYNNIFLFSDQKISSVIIINVCYFQLLFDNILSALVYFSSFITEKIHKKRVSFEKKNYSII